MRSSRRHTVLLCDTVLLCAAIATAPCAQANEGSAYPSGDEFAAQARVGDLYSCLSADGAWALFAWIGSIDRVGGQVAYGVQITPVVEGLPRIAHAPFVAGSFARCLPDPTAAEQLGLRFDAEAFETGHATWKANAGGVFTIDILDIYRSMSSIPPALAPSADATPTHEKSL